jgi:hypothetical protein
MRTKLELTVLFMSETLNWEQLKFNENILNLRGVLQVIFVELLITNILKLHVFRSWSMIII